MRSIWFQYDSKKISKWFQYDLNQYILVFHFGKGLSFPGGRTSGWGLGGGAQNRDHRVRQILETRNLQHIFFCSTGYAEYFRICWVSLAFFRICWILFALFIDILSFIRIFLGYGWVWLALFIDMLSLISIIYWHFEFHWHYFGYVEFHLHYLLTFWVSFALFRKRLNLISIRSLYHQEEHVSPYSSGRSDSSKHLWTHQRELFVAGAVCAPGLN